MTSRENRITSDINMFPSTTIPKPTHLGLNPGVRGEKPINSRPVMAQSFRNIFFFSLALQPPWALASSFSFVIIFTDGRTPSTSD
jgi:hypothetical protein